MWKRALYLLCVVSGLAGCDRSPGALTGAGNGPELNWMNNPDNGNPRITRFEDHFIACWSDATNGLRACHSTIPLGDGTETDCGPQSELDPVAFQDVGLFQEDDFSRIRSKVKGQLWITVRDLNQPGDCFDNKLVAEGWGNFHLHDNSLFGVDEGSSFTNAWGLRGNGKLLTPEGETVNYNGQIHFQFSNQKGFVEFPPRVRVH